VTNLTFLTETLRRLADQCPDHQEETQRIIQDIMSPPEEETEEEQPQT